jgi:hypothetical protein
MNEDRDIVRIRNFVTNCLNGIGAVVEFPSYNYAEALIPDELTDYFEDESYFKLTFDFDVARRHENAEFVTYGSYFLDCLTHIARQQGLAGTRHISTGEINVNNVEQKLRGKIIFKGCKSVFLAAIPMLYHYALFNFKVSYISDDKLEEIQKVIVNLNTNLVDEAMSDALESAILIDKPDIGYPSEERHSIYEAYQAATAYLEKHIQTKIQELEIALKQRLQREKKRVEEYYETLSAELKERSAKIKFSHSDDPEKTKVFDEKLQVNEIDKQRRIKELEDKNRLYVSVLLFSGLLISQYKARCKYHIKRGKTERDLYVVWNPMLNSIDPIVCERCNKGLPAATLAAQAGTTEVRLCYRCGHIGCVDCIEPCSQCETYICWECGLVTCTVCGEPLCSDCKIVCANCSDIVCEKHVESCTCKVQAREAALEQEKQRRQAHIQSYQGLVEGEMQAYFDRYVEEHIDELDDKWKNAIVKAQESLLEVDKQKVRQALRSLDKEYPENAWVKLTLAMQLNPQRQKQEMLDLAKRVVRMTPNLALAHRVLAEAYELNEQPLEALGEYHRTLELTGEKQNEISEFAREHIEQIQSQLFQHRRRKRGGNYYW